MPKRVLTAVLLALCAPAFGQSLEPGEWEFTSSSSSPLLPKPQTATVRQCVKKEDADNPERWMGQQAKKNDCTFTPGKKTADSISWEMHCPKSNMRGSGTAKVGSGTVESDMRMTGEVQGRKFEIATRMTGKRLGPCKT